MNTFLLLLMHETIHSTSVLRKVTIPKMDCNFATHRIPKVIHSDNGLPFTSEENKTYMYENGIDHQKITTSLAASKFGS
jgi:hypothetical protein